jgi:hypothetical protein
MRVALAFLLAVAVARADVSVPKSGGERAPARSAGPGSDGAGPWAWHPWEPPSCAPQLESARREAAVIDDRFSFAIVRTQDHSTSLVLVRQPLNVNVSVFATDWSQAPEGDDRGWVTLKRFAKRRETVVIVGGFDERKTKLLRALFEAAVDTCLAR